MPLSAQVKSSIIQVAGRWAFERARMLQEESSRKPAMKSFEDLLKEHFNDYYNFLMSKFSAEEKTREGKQ
jgi:hypothetical protein